MAISTSAAVTPAVPAGSSSRRNINTLPLVSPAVGLLFLWMIVPLVMTLWFSFQYYNLLDPTVGGIPRVDNNTNMLK